MAWATIALLRAYKAFGDPNYLNAARALGKWIEGRSDTRGAGGYTAGFTGFENDPKKLLYKATEHNIDVYVAFATLADVTSGSESEMWRAGSLYAKQFVRSMWQACGSAHFATGTLDDGSTPNCNFFPEDVNTWGLMALGEASMYSAGVSWVHANAQLTEPCPSEPLTGVDFNTDRDGIWWEGTAHTAIADEILGNTTSATLLLQNLRKAQSSAPHANGMGIVATCHDGVTTGISNFLLYNRLHIAATSWYIFAELGQNPFWGIRTSDPIPHQGG